MKTNLPLRFLNLGLAFSLAASPLLSHANTTIYMDKGKSSQILNDLRIDLTNGSMSENIKLIRSFITANRTALNLGSEGEIILIAKQPVTRDGITSIRLQQYARINRKALAKDVPDQLDSEKQNTSRIEIAGAIATALFDSSGQLISLDSGLVAPPPIVQPNSRSLVMQMNESEDSVNLDKSNSPLDQNEVLELGKLFESFYSFYKESGSKKKALRAEQQAKVQQKTQVDYSFQGAIERAARDQKPPLLNAAGKPLAEKDAYIYLFEDKSGKNFFNVISQLSKRSLLRMFVNLRKQKRADVVMQKTDSDEPQTIVRLRYPYEVPIQVDIDATSDKLKVIRVLDLQHKAVSVEIPGVLWPQVPGQVILPNVQSTNDERFNDHSNQPPPPPAGQFRLQTPATVKDMIDAKDAAFNILQASEFFLKNFQWNSYNNQGANIRTVVSVTMEGLKENAAWAGSPLNFFLFGAGGNTLANLPKATDVIGHEYFHAIVGATANLDHSDQSGALNEHGADFFGVAVQRSQDGRVDWQIGESVLTKEAVAKKDGKSSLRNMLFPEMSWSDQPKHMSEIQNEFMKAGGTPTCVVASKDNDNCQVHYQAGVPNLAIASAVVDIAHSTGQDVGVVFDSMTRILFNVFTMRLRSTSNFQDYMRETVAECKRQAGKPETMSLQSCDIIKLSFQRVGVGG